MEGSGPAMPDGGARLDGYHCLTHFVHVDNMEFGTRREEVEDGIKTVMSDMEFNDVG